MRMSYELEDKDSVRHTRHKKLIYAVELAQFVADHTGKVQRVLGFEAGTNNVISITEVTPKKGNPSLASAWRDIKNAAIRVVKGKLQVKFDGPRLPYDVGGYKPARGQRNPKRKRR